MESNGVGLSVVYRPEVELCPECRAKLAKFGRIGGRIGGRARIARRTPTQIAVEMARARSSRWKK